MTESEPDVEVEAHCGHWNRVFGKWDASGDTETPVWPPYINLTTVGVPHTEVGATPTHGLENQSCRLLSDTSTSSCEPVRTPGRKWAL